MIKKQSTFDAYADRAIRALSKPLCEGGSTTQLDLMMCQEKRQEVEPFYHHVWALLEYARHMRGIS